MSKFLRLQPKRFHIAPALHRTTTPPAPTFYLPHRHQTRRTSTKMPEFTVLTSTDVQNLLRNAGPSEISHFASIMSTTLHQYSTTNEADYQPLRTTVARSGLNYIFMPSTSASASGIKFVNLPMPDWKGQPGQKPPLLKGTLTLCDANGDAMGVLNAAELTSFRTSLCALLLLKQRKVVSNVVVFGAGKQAYWHARLAIILRGKDVQTLTVVNRSRASAEELVESLKSDQVLKDSLGHISFAVLSPSDEGYEENLKATVAKANAIHCTVPTTQPLFPAEWLATDSRLKQDLYISAIGSYRLDMQEIDPQLLRQIVSSDAYVPKNHKTPVVIVDSRHACLEEAGELVNAELTGENLLEAGELIELMKGEGEGEDPQKWLESGLVVFKCVGFGIMDISIGRAIVELARDKGVGVSVKDF